jgi:glycosyltransferase involved in cell wall biosynthesis
MRIAQVAPPLESVPPGRYGGTERVISVLTEELVRRGHEVTLFASADSRTSSRLIPTVERALWRHDPPPTDLGPFWAVTLGQVWEHRAQFDLIHSHVDLAGYPLARAISQPMISTLHGRLDLPHLSWLYHHFDELPLVSISDAQRRPVPWANWVATVHHGIDLEAFAFVARPGPYLAFVGRISPEKGLDVAIRVAHRAGMPLKIAARRPLPRSSEPEVRADWEYFEAIEPLLHEPGVEYLGELGGRDKATLLEGAAGLLFPIQWPEPFGLVMPEALACGTPVLALRRGSVPEVIEHGKTGFVCDSEDELVAAVDRLDRLDRAACRATAERRFSPAAMATAYEVVYERVCRAAMNGWQPNARAPRPADRADVARRLVGSLSRGGAPPAAL